MSDSGRTSEPLFIPDGFVPGVFYNEPDEVYFTHRLGVASNSKLKIVDEETPAKYLALVTGKLPPRVETEALAFGKAFHCMVLEPAEFIRRYAVYRGQFNRNTNAGRLDYSKWLNDNDGKSVISSDTFAVIRAMRESLMRHKTARLMVEKGRREVVFRWFDKDTGLPCEGKLDLWDEEMGFGFDLKSTEDAGPVNFGIAVTKYRYHVQHCMYAGGAEALGVNLSRFFLAPVEKSAPNLSALYHINEAAAERGLFLLRRSIGKLAACVRAMQEGTPLEDAFPGYGNDIQSLGLPGWAFADR